MGWRQVPKRIILEPMAIFPRPVSPVRAINDLRQFLSQRERHELIFAFLAVILTTLLIAGFYVDSRVDKPWKRDIQYFQSWPADRSDEQIRAQLAIDMKRNAELRAKAEKLKQERMRQFQKLDKQLDDLGL